MHFLRQAYASTEKFKYKNIPPPMATNNYYETLANKIKSFTKDVAEVTMRDATIEIHNNTSNTNNSATVLDTSLSWDGT